MLHVFSMVFGVKEMCEHIYIYYGTKLYSTMQYINLSVSLSSEIRFLVPKIMEKTYNIPMFNSFVKNCTLLYITTQNCTALCST